MKSSHAIAMIVMVSTIATAPTAMSQQIERMNTSVPHIPLDIDWRQWEKVGPDTGLSEDAYMHRQTWFDDWNYVYHVALWENFNDNEDPASLIVTRVDQMGDSPYKQSSRAIGDSGNPEYWAELDRLFGSRRSWNSVLSNFHDYVKHHPYSRHGGYDD